MARAGCSGMSEAIVSPIATESSLSSAITINVIEQARRTPAPPCFPSSTHSAASSFRIFSGDTVVLISRFPPCVSAACEHFVRGRRPPTSRGVVRKFELRVAPHVLDRLDHGPTRLHHVLPRVQRRIANDRVQQQRFVGGRRALSEARPVIKIHRYRPERHPGARPLGKKLQRNPLFRLDAQ